MVIFLRILVARSTSQVHRIKVHLVSKRHCRVGFDFKLEHPSWVFLTLTVKPGNEIPDDGKERPGANERGKEVEYCPGP